MLDAKRPSAVRRIAAASATLLALTAQNSANASIAGCRTIPVVAARCFMWGDARWMAAHCRAIPYASQPCFTVHGELVSGAGTFLRLWPVGSRRILGVFGGEANPESPKLVPRNVPLGPDLDVYGDFRVCPLATDQPGFMRPVCMISADHLVSRRRAQR